MSLIAKILVTQLVELIIGVPVAVLFWPATLVLWIIVKCARLSVQYWLDTVGADNEGWTYTLAEGEDAIFGYQFSNNSNSIIPGYCVIEGKFDLDLILKRCGQMVAGNPRLTHRFTPKFGFYCWAKNDDEFDLRNHVRMLTGPNEVVEEYGLMQIMESLAVKPIDDNIPSWELLLIPSFRCSGGRKNDPIRHYAEILRVHHAYGDGVSFCLTSNAYLFDTPAILPLDPKEPFPVPPWALPIQYVKVALLGPLYFLRESAAIMMDQSKFITTKYAETKYMSRSATSVSLAMLKELKSISRASVTAILISAISSSLEKAHRNLFPGEEIPSNIITANVNAILPYPDDKIRNRFTIFPFPAPLAQPDLKKRLSETNAAGYRVTLGPSPLFCYFILKFVGQLPRVLQNLIINQGGTPVMLSNIPGIVDIVKVFDGQCVDSGAWLPLIRATGVAIATYTYRGELRFCGIADPHVFPCRSDLQQFLDDIVKEVHQLAHMYKDKKSEKKRVELIPLNVDEENSLVKYVQRYLHAKQA